MEALDLAGRLEQVSDALVGAKLAEEQDDRGVGGKPERGARGRSLRPPGRPYSPWGITTARAATDGSSCGRSACAWTITRAESRSVTSRRRPNCCPRSKVLWGV